MNVSLLDYGAGNVRSVRNALHRLGHTVRDVRSAEDILAAERLVFPGVGSFALVMHRLQESGYVEPLRQRVLENKHFLGICVALQILFEGSEESPSFSGLGIISGMIKKISTKDLPVPQIGWNNIKLENNSRLFNDYKNEKLYFVHSYHAPLLEANRQWALATTDYGSNFIAAVERENICAFQFHPEKSGPAGLKIIDNFLIPKETEELQISTFGKKTQIGKRIIACLDVRSNEAGDLVVTKGDQYDVRDDGEIRNLGEPVNLAKRYYEEGADEITFLNITGFRDCPLDDQPMLQVLRKTSENVFVPLTIGGGIREFTDSEGVRYSSLDVAAAYFRSGADKISIGSDAVFIVEEFLKTGKKTAKSSIEQISTVYGSQAVVVSVDPRRIYVHHPDETSHTVIKTVYPGPKGELYCWYQCTVKGGRKGLDVDVVQLVSICERLGAGEILLNCIDRDGTNSGFDLELINLVKNTVSIPVIASSGAGKTSDFVDVFTATSTDAALAAGIFHRQEVSIAEVKDAVRLAGFEVR